MTLATALNAAFLPSETAMHVAYYSEEPKVNEGISKITIDESQYHSLVEYILNTFRLNNAKVELIPNRGYWRNDNFYEANHSYHLFNTCNSWTNSGLKLINIKTGIFALSADGIMRHLK